MKFQLHVESDNETGKVLAVYFRLRQGRSATVREFSGGAAFADFNKKGELLGVELLEPCQISVLNKITEDEPLAERTKARNFMRSAVPRAMVKAS